MKILYIDTSSSYLYSAIVEENKIMCQVKQEFAHTLSEVALPEIIKLFEESKTTPEEIEKIIVVNGPGSFTGIRIGITIAKVYAWSRKIPITTISALEAMALSSKQKTYHVPMIDARRGYVFSAIYDAENRQILKPQHIKIEVLKQKLQEITDYSIITNDEIEDFPKKETYDPDILKIVMFAKNRKNINPHAVNPEYLKLTEAEENHQS